MTGGRCAPIRFVQRRDLLRLAALLAELGVFEAIGTGLGSHVIPSCLLSCSIPGRTTASMTRVLDVR